MSTVALRYIRSIKKHLTCTPATKRKLTAHLEAALTNYLDEQPDATLEMLYTAFGAPEQMAATMMQDLPQSEREAYHRQNRLRRILIGSVITLLFLFTMHVFFIKQKPIENHVEITPYESTVETSAPDPLA